MRFTVKQIVWLKVLLHLAGFLPLVWLFWAGHQGYFSADPAKDIQHFTGRMALKFLLATLLVSPLARYAKQPLLIRVRRLLGLWCFAWATLHLTSYTLLELGINNLALLGSEIITRPLSDIGHDQLGDSAGAGGDLHASDAAKTGASLATFTQLRLSGSDPRADTLPVVSEDRLAAARYICPAGSGAIDMALQEVPPVVARNPVMCSFPQILYQPRLFFR